MVVDKTGAESVVVCMCMLRGGALRSENTSNYECYPLPGSAVKGTGIKPRRAPRRGRLCWHTHKKVRICTCLE